MKRRATIPGGVPRRKRARLDEGGEEEGGDAVDTRKVSADSSALIKATPPPPPQPVARHADAGKEATASPPPLWSADSVCSSSSSGSDVDDPSESGRKPPTTGAAGDPGSTPASADPILQAMAAAIETHRLAYDELSLGADGGRLSTRALTPATAAQMNATTAWALRVWEAREGGALRVVHRHYSDTETYFAVHDGGEPADRRASAFLKARVPAMGGSSTAGGRRGTAAVEEREDARVPDDPVHTRLIALQDDLRRRAFNTLAAPPAVRGVEHRLALAAEEYEYLEVRHRRQLEGLQRLDRWTEVVDDIIHGAGAAASAASSTAGGGSAPVAAAILTAGAAQAARVRGLLTVSTALRREWAVRSARQRAVAGRVVDAVNERSLAAAAGVDGGGVGGAEERDAGDAQRAWPMPPPPPSASAVHTATPAAARSLRVEQRKNECLYRLLVATEVLARRRGLDVREVVQVQDEDTGRQQVQMVPADLLALAESPKDLLQTTIHAAYERLAPRIYLRRATRLGAAATCAVRPQLERHQNEICTFLEDTFAARENCVLADDAGVGKRTALLAHIVNDVGLGRGRGLRIRGRNLVVVDEHAVAHWRGLVEHWCPELVPMCFYVVRGDAGRELTRTVERVAAEYKSKERMTPMLLIVTHDALHETLAAVVAHTPLRVGEVVRWDLLVFDTRGVSPAVLPTITAELAIAQARHRVLVRDGPPPLNVDACFGTCQFLYPVFFAPGGVARARGRRKDVDIGERGRGGFVGWLTCDAGGALGVPQRGGGGRGSKKRAPSTPSRGDDDGGVALHDEDTLVAARRLLQLSMPFYLRRARHTLRGFVGCREVTLECAAAPLQRLLYRLIARHAHARYTESGDVSDLAVGAALAKKVLEHPLLLRPWAKDPEWLGEPPKAAGADADTDMAGAADTHHHYVSSSGKLAMLDCLLRVVWGSMESGRYGDGDGDPAADGGRVHRLAINAGSADVYAVLSRYLRSWAAQRGCGHRVWFLRPTADAAQQLFVTQAFAKEQQGMLLLLLGTHPMHCGTHLNAVDSLVLYDTVKRHTLNTLLGLCRPCKDEVGMRLIKLQPVLKPATDRVPAQRSIEQLREVYFADTDAAFDADRNDMATAYLKILMYGECRSHATDVIRRHFAEMAGPVGVTTAPGNVDGDDDDDDDHALLVPAAVEVPPADLRGLELGGADASATSQLPQVLLHAEPSDRGYPAILLDGSAAAHDAMHALFPSLVSARVVKQRVDGGGGGGGAVTVNEDTFGFLPDDGVTIGVLETCPSALTAPHDTHLLCGAPAPVLKATTLEALGAEVRGARGGDDPTRAWVSALQTPSETG